MREKLIELVGQVQDCGCDVTDVVEMIHVENDVLADHLIANGVIVMPCKVGDTVYKIVKFCDENTGYKEFYRPSKEFVVPCVNYIPAEWEIEEECSGCDSLDDATYCSLNLNIFCERCKERIAIQKDKFEFSMMRMVFNTPMFDNGTPLRDTLYLTKEEAEQALKRLASTPTPPKEG